MQLSEAHSFSSDVFPLGMQEGQSFSSYPKKSFDYYPFGLSMPGRSNNTANPNDNYKFTGHERDEEAGLTIDHMDARGMDPVLGRMMQIDSRAEKYPGISPYAYVLNSPVNFTDMTGDTVDVDDDLWMPVNDVNGKRITDTSKMTTEQLQRHQFQEMWVQYGDDILALFHTGGKYETVNLSFKIGKPKSRSVSAGQVVWNERGVGGNNYSSEMTSVTDPNNLEFNVYLNPNYNGKSAYNNTSEHELQHVTIMFTDAMIYGSIRHAAPETRNGVKGQHLLTPVNPDLTKTLKNMLNHNYKKF